MRKKVVCPICGTEFMTDRPNRKYCSLNCKEASIKLKQMRFLEENPTYFRDYMRERRRKEEGKKNG